MRRQSTIGVAPSQAPPGHDVTGAGRRLERDRSLVPTRCLAVVTGLFLISGAASAQVIIEHFAPPVEASPVTTPLVEGADGNLYGITLPPSEFSFSGSTVFRMTADGSMTLVHSFTGDEPQPISLTRGADGQLYGIGRNHPPKPTYELFTLAPDGTFTSLAPGSGANELQPGDPVVQGPDGDFDFLADGQLMRITPGGSSRSSGVLSSSLVLGADTNIYLTGPLQTNLGAVLKLTASGTVTVLHAFTRGADGGTRARWFRARTATSTARPSPGAPSAPARSSG